MAIAHEEAARSVYPSAHDFSPVFRGVPGLTRKMVGWIFQIKIEDEASEKWSWVTLDHQVSSDPVDRHDHASRVLCVYVANRGAISRGHRSAANASAARSVAINGDSNGSAVPFDNFKNED